MKEYDDYEVPINKPEHTMKLKFIGDTFYYGIDGLTDGKIYEAWEEDKDYYRVETLWKVIPPLYAL